MGGLGSGQWLFRDAKSTVEESFVLSISSLRQGICPGAHGTITWSRADGPHLSVNFFVTSDAGALVLTLRYRWRDQDVVELPIRLHATGINSGGRRWWFTCPLSVNGVPCGRRAGKLYLPPGGRYFGCRRCHRLTYRSAQQAHLKERLLASQPISSPGSRA
jgi:hypothetical protein